MRDLDPTSGSYSWAYAINSSGQIVGGYIDDGVTQPCVWPNTQTRMDLPLNNGFGNVRDINDTGQMAGGSGQHAVLWTLQ